MKTEELPGLMREAVRQGYKQAPQDLDKKENTPRKKTKGLKWVLGAAIGTAIAVTVRWYMGLQTVLEEGAIKDGDTS